jgi:hypothetical protein
MSLPAFFFKKGIYKRKIKRALNFDEDFLILLGNKFMVF